MPVWLVLVSKQLLWQLVIPVVVKWLRAHGYITAATNLATEAVIAIKNMKTYPDYDIWKNNRKEETPPAVTNIVTGRKPEDQGG